MLGSCVEAAVVAASGSGDDLGLAQRLLEEGIAACATAYATSSVACIQAGIAQASGTGLSSIDAVANVADACQLYAPSIRSPMPAPPAPSLVASLTWRTGQVVGWYNLIQFVIMPWVFLWVFSGTILGLIRFVKMQYQLVRLGVDMFLLMGLFVFVTIEETALTVLRVLYAKCNATQSRQYRLEWALENAENFEDYSRVQGELTEHLANQEACCNRPRGRPRTLSAETDHGAWLEKTLAQPDLEFSTLEPLLVREPGGIDWASLQQSDALLESLSRKLRELCESAAEKPGQREELLTWLRARQKTLGVTALCLSGGGTLALYHGGFCKFLLQEGLMPKVISAVSGGAISAGLIAIHTDEELLQHIFVKEVVARHGIRWFPPLWQEILNFFRIGALVPTADFEATTNAYYGTWTFEEAFARTGREVSIVVSSNFSRQLPGCVMLNHQTAPRVTIASAVATSCAAMGIMKPRGLVTKDPVTGELRPFDVYGKSFQDGTMSAEFPKDYLRSFYGATQFLVSQVNPHVHAFMGQKTSTFQTLRSYFGNDLQKRARLLSEYRLMPAFFGRTMSQGVKHIAQDFSETKTGLTVFSPDMGIYSVKVAVSNPSIQDMHKFIMGGQRMAWQKAKQIRALMRTETTLVDLIERLEPTTTHVQATTDSPPKFPPVGLLLPKSPSSASMGELRRRAE